jgi:hypothetical protein
LSWRLLEAKLQYYNPEKIHPSHGNDYVYTDTVYDAMEAEYRKLCDLLGKKPTACEHVGFPFHTPSGRIILEKLSNRKKSRT